MEKQINTNNDHNYKSVASITPSGFFGTGNENIVELKNFLTDEERIRLTEFAKTNKKPSETGDAPQRFVCHNIALYIQIKGNVLRAQ